MAWCAAVPEAGRVGEDGEEGGGARPRLVDVLPSTLNRSRDYIVT